MFDVIVENVHKSGLTKGACFISYSFIHARKSNTKTFIIYNNEHFKGVPRTIVAPIHSYNLLQIFTVLHYFGELITIDMRQFMVGKTVDSILVKEGRV